MQKSSNSGGNARGMKHASMISNHAPGKSADRGGTEHVTSSVVDKDGMSSLEQTVDARERLD
jgi:hypothetical protein